MSFEETLLLGRRLIDIPVIKSNGVIGYSLVDKRIDLNSNLIDEYFKIKTATFSIYWKNIDYQYRYLFVLLHEICHYRQQQKYNTTISDYYADRFHLETVANRFARRFVKNFIKHN